MPSRKTFFLFIILALYATLFFSCGKNDTQARQSAEEAQVKEHQWYYFTGTGYFKTDLPQSAPAVLMKPWTESVRVSSAAKSGSYSCFLVNRTGLLRFGTGKEAMSLFTDKAFFSGSTADGLFTLDGEPVFNVYKSSFFNTANSASSPVLIQFRPNTGFFIPVLKTQDLGVPAQSQPVSVSYDGKNLTAAFKTDEGEKVSFIYLQISSYEPLLALLPEQRKSALFRKEITADVFRELNAQKKFSAAPAALKQLLSRLPETLTFQVECMQPDAGTPQTWVRAGTANENEPLCAQALVTDTFALAVFADGTSYFAGALPGKYVLKNGQTAAFRLPKLPPDFTYTYIALEGSTLYAAWEEERFFETGRSGFLSADLEKVLYK